MPTVCLPSPKAVRLTEPLPEDVEVLAWDGSTPAPGRSGEPVTAEQGCLHCGPAGAGHFVKMVHNGIEYGRAATGHALR